MKIIDFKSIEKLDVSAGECVSWVKEAFKLKKEVTLPPKISMKMDGNIFFNTMPCYIPSLERIGIKLVSRYPERIPSLKSDLLLYNSIDGTPLALVNADWITAMRTGAVAALSIDTLEHSNAKIYAFVGLGNTARATLLCLLSNNQEKHYHIRILEYKDQASIFIERFKMFDNVTFEIVQNNEELVHDADVIVSCVTALDSNFAKDESYKEGVLIVPVHTRGFQNCDLFFDKVFGDDYDHVKDFKYFNRFKSFTEFSDVLTKNEVGRTNDQQRIIIYNIGIALHDVYFAAKLYDQLEDKKLEEVNLTGACLEKNWI